MKTTRDDRGWFVEMRIPFSSMKFKSVNEVTVMGLIISRNISANNETDTYPAIDPRYGNMSTSKPSQALTITIEGARPTRPLYLSPYLLGGFSRGWSLSEDETGYIMEDEPQYNAGLDIKYNINSNLTLDLTANTDFAQPQTPHSGIGGICHEEEHHHRRQQPLDPVRHPAPVPLQRRQLPVQVPAEEVPDRGERGHRVGVADPPSADLPGAGNVPEGGGGGAHAGLAGLGLAQEPNDRHLGPRSGAGIFNGIVHSFSMCGQTGI